MQKEIESMFYRESYRFLSVKPEFIKVFYKYYQEGFHVVMLVDLAQGTEMTAEGHRVMEERIQNIFFHPQGSLSDFPEGFPVYHVEVLTVLVDSQIDGVRRLCSQCKNTWGYLTKQNRLLIYENQPGDFWGLRQALENINPYMSEKNSMQRPGFRWKSDGKYMPYTTIAIVAINVIVYIILECLGDTENALFIASHGGMYPPLILYNNQWWRILTSGFLHFGIEHLANNMVIFSCVGSRVERALGHLRLLIIYLLALAGGGLLSFGVMVYTGEYAVAAGASGAVFGIIGALLWVVFLHRGRFEGMTTRGLIFMIALSLYYGFSTIGVDNWAHIGGIVTGFVCTAILYHGKRQKY